MSATLSNVSRAGTSATGGAKRSPAYLRIASELRDRIVAGALPCGSAVPSERDLAKAAGVHRMTARHAVSLLENEGYVERRHSRGTFVAAPRIQLRLTSFFEDVSRRGGHPVAEILWSERRRAPASVAEALGAEPDELVHVFQRLRRADGEPVAVETTYLRANLDSKLLERSRGESLWALLREQHGVTAVRSTNSIGAIALDESVAKLLGVRTASPGIRVRRHTYDQDDHCLAFGEDVYRADRVEFLVDVAPVSTKIPGRKSRKTAVKPSMADQTT